MPEIPSPSSGEQFGEVMQKASSLDISNGTIEVDGNKVNIREHEGLPSVGILDESGNTVKEIMFFENRIYIEDKHSETSINIELPNGEEKTRVEVEKGEEVMQVADKDSEQLASRILSETNEFLDKLSKAIKSRYSPVVDDLIENFKI